MFLLTDRRMRISYLAECPELATQLVPALLEHWSYIFPNQTAAERAAKFQAHQNRDELPIAWVAHDGNTALGTAALRQFETSRRQSPTEEAHTKSEEHCGKTCQRYGWH